MYLEKGGLDEGSSMSMHGSGYTEAHHAFSQSYPQNMELQIDHCFTTINAADIQSSNWNPFNQNFAPDFNQFYAPKAAFAEFPDLLPNFPPNSAASLFPLNPPPQLFYSLPNGNSDFDFTEGGENGDGIGDSIRNPREKQRRVVVKGKYEALRALIPTPTKIDRASIVGDAIGYIKELKTTVAELKVLVERKRRAREDEKGGSISSWLHRKTKNTEVDVRIVDDEITVKLVQDKRINCLLFASKVLDEMPLDLNHVAGGLIDL
ncbi:transcription factor bHLH10-like isoform X2 [Salvia hispanica]|uniref:transcription factor bHLH10-like isoform X2 n=1 Tax=Salvia hispanica TaxID=49212 RepID=UPI0020090A7F|nr:transcription factor bHLH10-like isoform X2 [Salvia hispanica]